jgi:hypothetical protein
VCCNIENNNTSLSCFNAFLLANIRGNIYFIIFFFEMRVLGEVVHSQKFKLQSMGALDSNSLLLFIISILLYLSPFESFFELCVIIKVQNCALIEFLVARLPKSLGMPNITC